MLTPSAAIEAVLFASGEPFQKRHLAALLGMAEPQLRAALETLAGELGGRGVALVETSDAVELRAAADAAELLKAFREGELSRDLGKASLETLAVVAYAPDGATRSHVDWVRGVNSTASLRTLLMRGLVAGEEDAKDRRRIRYRLTTEALAHLGLARASELPRYDELAAGAQKALEEPAAADAHGA